MVRCLLDITASTHLRQCFNKVKRAEIVAKHPELKNTEIMGKLAELWGGLSAADRAPYEKLAAEDKARHVKKMESYTLDEAHTK